MSIRNIFFLACLVLIASTSFTGCKSEKKPGFKAGENWVRYHFNQDIYQGLVEVVDVKLVDVKERNYAMGPYSGDFIHVTMVTTIDIKEDYVVSKLFYNQLEVNREWLQNFEAQMQLAENEQERKRISDAFNENTFSKGRHEINIVVDYSFMEERWLIFDANIRAL